VVRRYDDRMSTFQKSKGNGPRFILAPHDTVPFRAILAIASQRSAVDLERCRVVLELLSTASTVRTVFRTELTTLSLSELDFGALVTLYAMYPTRSTLANVTAQTGSARPSITEAVDRLEARSLLRRERDTEDRRVIFVHLTEEGRKTAEDGINRIIKRATRITRSIPPESSSGLVSLCRELEEAARKESQR